MLAWAWVIPAVIAVVGLAVVAGLARRAAEEAIGLRADVRRYDEMRAAMGLLGGELRPSRNPGGRAAP